MVTRALWSNPPVVFFYGLVAFPSRHAAGFIAGAVTGTQVLDVGTGTGIIAKAVAQKGVSLTGVDPSAQMLKYAVKIPGAKFLQGSATKLPVQDKSQDTLMYNYVLRYVSRKDLDTVIAEMDRVARDRATVIISDLMLPRLLVLDKQVLGALDWGKVKKELGVRGFKLTQTYHPFLSRVLVFKR